MTDGRERAADEPGQQAPHSARIYDYILGGKNNYAADREAAERMLSEWPALATGMRANRAFMHRVARHLAADRGIRQFLDIGTGLPSSPNLHEIVQASDPRSRIVYVDNDPLVLSHARALMTGSPDGTVACVEGDVRDPDGILAAPELHRTLDLDEPVALTVMAVIHFLLDEDEAQGVVRRLMAPLPSGSYLAMSIVTGDCSPEGVGQVADEYAARGIPVRPRTRAEAERFFEGLELVEPGVVQVHRWHPAPHEIGTLDDADVAMYGGVARKP